MSTVILPILITFGGLYLLIKLRAFFILHPIKSIKVLVSSFKRDKKRSTESLCLALAGTLGVGNISGVAMGIILGGAGSVFWLFISSLFSSVLKYSETVLSIDLLKKHGTSGMMRIVQYSFKKHGKPLGVLYAFLCILIALTMGSALQANAILDSARECDLSPAITAAVLVVLVVIAITKFGSNIEKITAYIIPLTTVIYILLSFWVIFTNTSKLPGVIELIIKSAFTPESIGGGILTFLFSKRISEGYARGILSNEAGAGTSSLAHIKNTSADPVEQGLLGMCEVFFDTTLLCMLSAFSILLAVPDFSSYKNGMSLIISAFSSVLGSLSGYTLLLLIFLFAFSTVVCWYYYGKSCFSFVFPKITVPIFETLFILFLALGAFFDSIYIISSVDFLLLFLVILSLGATIKGSDRVKHLSEQRGLVKLKNTNVAEVEDAIIEQ